MKSALRIFVVVMAIGYAGNLYATNPLPTKDVIIAVNDVFIPGGFDSTADSYVVVSGIFPNGCYRWKEANVNHTTTYSHEVTSVAAVTQGMCIQVMIPFSKDVRLGQLATGMHSLKFLSSDGTYLEKKLVIE